MLILVKVQGARNPQCRGCQRFRANPMKSGPRSLSPTLSNGLTTVGLFAMILGTSPTFNDPLQLFFAAIVVAAWIAIAAKFALRLRKLRTWARQRLYLTSAEGLIDAASVLALPCGWLMVSEPKDALLFALAWALRYIRHTAGLALFWRVMQRSRTALLSIASLFLAIFFVASTLAYIFERQIQPEVFGSVPRAMWWAIVTLTTTGYGDVTPVTVWGRLLGGWVMVGGVVMFALQAGIIATAFAEELQRRHFLHTWDLVTTVPFFQDLGAAAIADIVRLLESRDVAEGTVIVRKGEPGDTMYFVVSGEATVQLSPAPVVLTPGSFFGEMALLFGTPRSATVVATKPSVLLVLDVADLRQLAGRRPELVNLIEAEARRRREANSTTQALPARAG
ncbi:MAG: cyclic nucleotide-binding domain-containing protein [Bradyrhizobium sp.]|uniref:cyclic nucleotide-gated ion channel n=1 Tax=Bradyrhizobium sp. TaxID=376 RepID=UPI0025C273BA|nr:cyclic nucleotide-gated ion channel [Bradyrhizobium sp.]MBI5263594.1 cyclic nucleotide-binding domain-containing protein [Bradyrhizobium sp.]